MYQIMPNAYNYLVNCIKQKPIASVLIASLVGAALAGSTTALAEKSSNNELEKAAANVTDNLKQTVKTARQQAGEAYETIAKPVKSNPLTSTLIASLVGSLVTWLIQRRG